MKRIVIIDDDVGILEALGMVLESEGYEVLKVGDGHRAEEEVLDFKPDLIMLDLLLGGRDGVEICQAIKNDDSTSHIPVIMMSAHPEAAEHLKECGSVAFLSKPFSMDELLELVQSHVGSTPD